MWLFLYFSLARAVKGGFEMNLAFHGWEVRKKRWREEETRVDDSRGRLDHPPNELERREEEEEGEDAVQMDRGEMKQSINFITRVSWQLKWRRREKHYQWQGVNGEIRWVSKEEKEGQLCRLLHFGCSKLSSWVVSCESQVSSWKLSGEEKVSRKQMRRGKEERVKQLRRKQVVLVRCFHLRQCN